MVLAAHAPGVPVLVGRDRTLVGWRALAAFGAEVLVLDDGFQHHRLHRDVDIVVFDGALGFGNRRCLPRGPLREPLRALRRAQAVGVVDGPLAEEDAALLARHAPGAFCFAARRRPAGLRGLSGGDRQDPELLRGQELGMLCGLARHRYRRADLAGLADEAPLWITTEKDAVKITPPWAGAADLRVLSIELAVDEPEALLGWLEACLR
jgi:tetraacyldisaccharide 4'-kinase